MRRFILGIATVATLAGAGMLAGNRVEAMPLINTSPLSGAAAALPVEQVYLQCTRFWNGWRWVRRCVETGPAYYGPGVGVYGPAYGYYGWRRPRYYGYY